MKKLFDALSLVLLMFACSHADVILSPTSVVSNTLGENLFAPAERTIDQSGLSAAFTSGVTDFSTYIGTNPTHVTSVRLARSMGWISASQPSNPDRTPNIDGTLVFDLGDSYSIHQMVLWQSQRLTAAKDLSIAFSNTPGFISETAGGNFTVNDATTGSSAAQVLDLTDATARYVRLHIQSIHQAVPASDHAASIGEIAFDVTAVPEPSSFVCLGLVGLVAVGFNWFKKRRQTA